MANAELQKVVIFLASFLIQMLKFNSNKCLLLLYCSQVWKILSGQEYLIILFLDFLPLIDSLRILLN